MKYIKRKSITKPIIGQIVDTTNIDNKTLNAPSINLYEQVASSSNNGLMSSIDKTKLDGLGNLASSSNNGLMSSADKAKLDALDMSGIITKTISINMSTANTWYDTGIIGSHLTSGTYIIQIDCTSFAGQANQWSETYSGVMTWYNEGTNGSHTCHVTLHNAGHADNGAKIQLRTIETPSGGQIKLQISCTVAMTAARNVVFKFRRII